MNSRNKYAVVEGLLCSCGLRIPAVRRNSNQCLYYDWNSWAVGNEFEGDTSDQVFSFMHQWTSRDDLSPSLTIPTYPPQTGRVWSLTVPTRSAGTLITTLKKQEGVE